MKLRPDIQALRGVAVLVVVLFHGRFNVMRGGYLGVDIFFVISGFLITSMVRKQIEKGSFSFADFYTRRAKRLLPAAYTTFLVTALLCVALLSSAELQQFAGQLLGAVTFTANIVLWRQGSYFGGDAELKPLLHTWSLSIEEQYYMLLPAFLFFLPRRFWVRAVIAGVVGSFAACFLVALWKPAVAFYLFPTRAWELGIGSLGGLLSFGPAAVRRIRTLFWPAVALLVLIPLFPFGGVHPGIDVLLVCSATIVIILSAVERYWKTAVVRSLAFVGDFSYSLYLVHWPILAILTNLWAGEVPLWARLAGVGIAFPLSYLQYRYVENPVRRAGFRITAPRLAFTIAVSFALALVPFAYSWNNAAVERYATLRRGNTGLGQVCTFNDRFNPSPACQSDAAPTMLIWGDSYAMHLIPGIDATRGNVSIAQATKYVCGPMLGVAPVTVLTGVDQNHLWSRTCLSFNDSVLDYLRRTPSVRTVVLSSVFKQYMSPELFDTIERDASGHEHESQGGVELGLRHMAQTVRAIRALGRKVVVVAPPPALDWDAGRCAERKLRGLPVYGAFSDCVIPVPAYLDKRRNVVEFLTRLPREAGVEVIAFDRVLYSGRGFDPIRDGEILYIANGHFSYEGSRWVARRQSLMQQIAARAR
jgi:peptidoglycan/LPS O-acetylase OafA/YrhL